MSTRPSPENTVRRALWLGGLFVVLGGLFGMHGLDTHGVESAENASMTGSPAHSDADHQTMTRATDGAALAMAATSATGGHSGMGMDMGTGMCVAVLVLGLLALLLRISTCRPQRLEWLVARGIRIPETQGRDPDPPSLIRLSIQRC